MIVSLDGFSFYLFIQLPSIFLCQGLNPAHDAFLRSMRDSRCHLSLLHSPFMQFHLTCKEKGKVPGVMDMGIQLFLMDVVSMVVDFAYDENFS